jgi:hypothetical protein
LEQLGLTLAEAKQVLREVQQQIVNQQVAAFLAGHVHCPACGRQRGTKDHKTLTFRTLFGKLRLASPRLRQCACQAHPTQTVSPLSGLLPEHTAPELLYLESKWASLVSYGLTVRALRDFLPVDDTLNAGTVRNHTLSVARRCEAELGPEPLFPLEGCLGDCMSPPPTPGPITVGIDGGYLRNWERKQTRFAAIVGKSVLTDGAAKCFGFVPSQDKRPRRRLYGVLQAQGVRHDQEVAFLSDGEDSIRQLQLYLRPHSTHLLDWFHLSMRLTGLGQFLKALARLDPHVGGIMQQDLERTKWKLWHGKVDHALERFWRLEVRMWSFATRYPKFRALARRVFEFQGYVRRNRHLIRNYGARWRARQVISTAFVESLVNCLLSKRFAKKQQMQWTPAGAHLLLQIRTRTLNGELAATFRTWYPAFSHEDHAPAEQLPLAA